MSISNDRNRLIWLYENGEWELYDLLEDKNELNNVYNAVRFKKDTKSINKTSDQVEKKSLKMKK